MALGKTQRAAIESRLDFRARCDAQTMGDKQWRILDRTGKPEMFPPLNYYRLVKELIAVALPAIAVWRWLRTRRWPIAQGTVEEARLEDVQDSNGMTHSMLVITYSYQVNGERYGGYKQAAPPQNSSFRQLVGTKVDVRYNPRKPEASALLAIPSAKASAASSSI